MKKHFLLVDQDKERLKTITTRLQEHFSNCKCTWADNVEHAIKMLPYLKPDTVLCYKEDLQHPVLKRVVSIKSIALLLYDDNTVPYEIFGQVFALSEGL